jgi:hypothetical protein
MAEERRTEREKILERIRALLSKTVDNGCTEQEAISAAEMVSKLLDKYDLSASDLEKEEPSDFARKGSPIVDDIDDRLWKPASAIEMLTGTRYWRGDGMLVFFGRSSDVEIAEYILKICERAMRTASERYERGIALYRPSLRRSKRMAFLDGMADSLRSKLEAIHAARRAQATGRALVLAKETVVDDEMARRQIQLVSSRMRRSRDLDDPYKDGDAAGKAVGFHDGLRGSRGNADALSDEMPA